MCGALPTLPLHTLGRYAYTQEQLAFTPLKLLGLDEARRKGIASRSTSGDSLALPTPPCISCSISKVLQ
jgi:hypothetical protein